MRQHAIDKMRSRVLGLSALIAMASGRECWQ